MQDPSRYSHELQSRNDEAPAIVLHHSLATNSSLGTS